MKQTKSLVLDKENRIICVALVRGYDARKKNYARKREDLLSASPLFSQVRRSSGDYTDPTTNKALALEELDRHPETRRMRAVEEALADLEPGLRQPLLSNIIDRVPYEHLPVPCCRDTFFRRKNKFLRQVARKLELGD